MVFIIFFNLYGVSAYTEVVSSQRGLLCILFSNAEQNVRRSLRESVSEILLKPELPAPHFGNSTP